MASDYQIVVYYKNQEIIDTKKEQQYKATRKALEGAYEEIKQLERIVKMQIFDTKEFRAQQQQDLRMFMKEDDKYAGFYRRRNDEGATN